MVCLISLKLVCQNKFHHLLNIFLGANSNILVQTRHSAAPLVCRVSHYLKCMPLTERASRCYPTLNKSCYSRLPEAAGVSPRLASKAPPDSGKAARAHAPRPGPYRSSGPGSARSAVPPWLGHMGGRAPALPPVSDGPGPPGRPRRPLKSAPIYISRRPPAPAGGGVGEIRLPFPSRGQQGERC